MRVTHLNTYTQGGAALAALRIHTALLNESVDSHFLALYKGHCKLPAVHDFRNELNAFDKVQKKIRNKLIRNRLQRQFKKAEELFSTLESVWDANQHSLTRQQGIIHLHWIHEFINLNTFFTARDRKYVWTVHDHFPFSGGFHYPPQTMKKHWLSKTADQKKALSALFNRTHIDVVLPSENLKSIAQSACITGSNRLHVIKNPVNTELFLPLNKEECRYLYKIDKNAKVLFYLADHLIYKRKGFHLLKEALEKLPVDITVLVAGRGNLPSKIGKATIKQMGLINDEAELARLYNCADLMVNPSLEDISSNTVIEATACGIPSVAFASGGIPELITAANGLLVKEKTSNELLNAILKALEHPFDSAAIRQKAEHEHALNVIAKQYMHVYQNL